MRLSNLILKLYAIEQCLIKYAFIQKRGHTYIIIMVAKWATSTWRKVMLFVCVTTMVDGIYFLEIIDMDILLAKYKEGEPLDLRMVSTQQGEYITELRNTGFIDFVPSEQPMAEPGKAVVETLEMVDGKLVQSWQIVEAEATESPEN